MRRRTICTAAGLGAVMLASGVFTSLAAQRTAAPDPNAYFEELVKRTDFWKGYSLRPRTGEPITSPYYELQLSRPNAGGYAHSNTYAYTVAYDSAMDAAKIVIPAFHVQDNGALAQSMRSSASGAEETITLTYDKGFNNKRALLIDDEIVVVNRVSGSTPSEEVTVVRGQFGTAAVAHRLGTPIYPSQNSLANQVRLPLGTEDGSTYMFTWDGYWTDSYLGLAVFPEHKTFQFSSGGDRIWLEPQTRFDGGRAASVPVGGISRPADFDRAVHVAGTEIRSYNFLSGSNSNWLLTDGNRLGPGVTLNEPLNPKTGAFAIHPNRWTRFWLLIEQRANDFDYMDYWVADEYQAPVQVYTRIPLSVRNGSIDKFWLEFNTSAEGYVRGNRRDLIAYVRNFAALRNPGDVTRLLQPPGPGAPRFSDGSSALTPPQNLRIVR